MSALLTLANDETILSVRPEEVDALETVKADKQPWFRETSYDCSIYLKSGQVLSICAKRSVVDAFFQALQSLDPQAAA
jgi:hypothetical protein